MAHLGRVESKNIWLLAVFQSLARNNLRLEQERISQEYVKNRLGYQHIRQRPPKPTSAGRRAGARAGDAQDHTFLTDRLRMHGLRCLVEKRAETLRFLWHGNLHALE